MEIRIVKELFSIFPISKIVYEVGELPAINRELLASLKLFDFNSVIGYAL